MPLMFALLAILFLTLVFLLLTKHRKDEHVHLAPGPKGIPLIGNLHQFDASKPHVYLANLAKTYGPILSLRFGRVPVVVVQSAKLAKEVLQTQDLNFSDRPQFAGSQKLSYNGLDIAFSPYNEYFREVKKISVVHLLNSKRVESFAPIGQEEVLRMIKNISSLSSASKIVNLSELVMAYSCSNMCRIAFGRRYEEAEASRSKFHTLLNDAQAMFIAFFFADYFPFGGCLDWLSGNSSRLERTFKDLDAFYEEIINDHLDPNRFKSPQEDIIDVLLNLKKQRCFELTLDHIKALLMNIFVAGTDTSSVMVVWAMTELVKNPHTMKKVQEEIRNVVQNKDFVDKNDLPKFKYFKAVVKETFRLHPAAPLLVAHESVKKTTIDGYDILPKTLVHINIWAIGRDPKLWKDPEKFMPERFFETSIDLKGSDFELLPFGAGTRMCPGLNLGIVNMELALANLLYSFDWEIPDGLTKEDIDTDVLPGIAMHKKNPLCLVAKET
ncbi:6,7,8-trihydroxycoumarin synthase [Beta vulgaris subsp. vulgaris]|uniref:6,7,8-trihydroxycoumarin synthase n=1 Tax=Beta vulgaris subsp. vulgaris TaxID=3555 RepID=UPI00053FD6E5|nr:6,7,8-trihydroxycoumarin synthase [Beta vulgaris subsp. vulgaris]